MDDDRRDGAASAPSRKAERSHLRVVQGPAGDAPPHLQQPRSIGRLIAHTALLADGAVGRRSAEFESPSPGRRRGAGLFGRFR